LKCRATFARRIFSSDNLNLGSNDFAAPAETFFVADEAAAVGIRG
jgi:hypothetical protein